MNLYNVDEAVFQGADPVHAIAVEVFTAMIDGEEGHLRIWDGEAPPLVDAVHAWVDVQGAARGRVLLTTEEPTAHHLTRALLEMSADEPVGDADMVDALGEVANVVGGNVKALVPDTGALTLPQVRHGEAPEGTDALLHELRLDWCGRPLVITLWSLP